MKLSSDEQQMVALVREFVDERVRRPTDEQRRALEALELAPRFKGRPLEDLAALELRLVARSASAS